MAEPAAGPPIEPSCAGPESPPSEPPKPVDFVCEADVLAARLEGRKIYIGPRSIVTAAARDAAEASDILVMS